MTLPRPSYLVEVLADPTDDSGTVHEVTVLYGDQMRAELEAGRSAVDMSQSFHITGLWVWAALARTGRTDLRWQEFAPRIAMITRPDQEVPPPDPTQPGVPTPSP